MLTPVDYVIASFLKYTLAHIIMQCIDLYSINTSIILFNMGFDKPNINI